MSKFKLADGSCSSLYEIGDTFVVIKGPTAKEGSIVSFHKDDGTSCPYFKGGLIHKIPSIMWDRIKPTPETKAKRCDFTKADLKDGMRCTDRDGDDWYVCGDFLIFTSGPSAKTIKTWNDNLTHISAAYLDIIRVTDRDGAVLFERKPEKKKVMLELTDEQLEQIKKEYGL